MTQQHRRRAAGRVANVKRPDGAVHPAGGDDSVRVFVPIVREGFVRDGTRVGGAVGEAGEDGGLGYGRGGVDRNLGDEVVFCVDRSAEVEQAEVGIGADAGDEGGVVGAEGGRVGAVAYGEGFEACWAGWGPLVVRQRLVVDGIEGGRGRGNERF